MASPDGLRLPPLADIDADVRRALAEDIGSGDLTADLLPADATATARVITREAAVVCGQAWFERCFALIDDSVEVTWRVSEGERVAANQTLCDLRGKARSLVTGERCALNFLQLLSATATVTASYVDAAAGTSTRILDTRKTIPGLRLAQKYAVRIGGGDNHRMGLYDAVLIKENHIAAVGSIASAVARARALHPGVFVEVESETLDEFDLALEAGADRIMLDEFSAEDRAEAVRRNAGRCLLEVSGGLGLEGIAEIAQSGVDCISVGALTKHVRAVDLSMRVTLD
ncbi:MAG: carboxylating nicotinate-nucleotide diphosphorylase [Dokdonella sp.]